MLGGQPTPVRHDENVAIDVRQGPVRHAAEQDTSHLTVTARSKDQQICVLTADDILDCLERR